MKNSADMLKTAPMSMLVLGAPGTGKTFLASFLPKPYFANADNNLRGVLIKRRTMGFTSPVLYDDILFASRTELEKIGMPKSDIDKLPVTKQPEGDEVLPVPREWRGRRLWGCISEAIASPDVETIVLDSLTTITSIVMDEVLRQQTIILPKKPGAFMSSLVDLKGGRTVDDPLEFAHWNAFGQLFRNLITTLKSSGKRVVAIGHIASSNDASGVPIDFIAVPGQFKETIAGYFEECWMLRVTLKGTNVDRQVFTVPPVMTQVSLGLKSGAGLPPNFTLDINKLLADLSIPQPTSELPK